MKRTNWKDVADLIGTAAVVASLVFVGVQLKQEHRMAMASSITEQTTSYQNQASLVNDNAETWRKGLAGEPLTASEALGFNALASAYEMLFVAAFERSSLIGGNPPLRYATQWAMQLQHHPGLLAHWKYGAGELEKVHELSGYSTVQESAADTAWRQTVNGQLERLRQVSKS